MSETHYQSEDEGPGPLGYLALVLAWAVPGLGHFLLGQRGRGIIFGLVIHLLFAAGLLIGGIRSINPPDQAIWTYTQFLTGWPMVIANQIEHASRNELLKIQQEYNDQHRVLATGPDGRAALLFRSDEDPAQREQAATDFISKHPLFSYHPKVQDIGAVYCGIAGMLNLLVMFDVLLRITGSTRESPAEIRKKVGDSAGGSVGAAASAGVAP